MPTTRYIVTNEADVLAVGLPKYILGTWDHYSTHLGEARLYRVVIAADVIALPDEGWSCGGFGSHISEEWLLTQPAVRIPGTKARRRVLVACVRAAMDEHHKRAKADGEGK